MNLKDYIQGQRHGKDANQLEREAMTDPFLQDAIDGYDSVKGDHLSAIEKLEKRVSSPRKRIGNRVWIWTAVAAIVLLIGIPLLLQIPKEREDMIVASSQITQEEKENGTTLFQEDTILTASHLELKKNEETTPKAKHLPSPSSAGQSSLKKTEKTVIKDPQKEITGVLLGRVEEIATSEQEPDGEPRSSETDSTEVQLDKISVAGRIVDETGEPIIGATVKFGDGDISTTTDIEGDFQLTVPKDGQKTLIASFIGMKNLEIPLKENAGDIMMKADDMALNEVVVIGYGTQKKRNQTGSAFITKKATEHIHVENTLLGRDPASVAKATKSFGKEEFKKYFVENYDKNICTGQRITIVVDFFINPIGQISQIDIKENSCPSLENEIKRLLLGSPPWSETNKKVTLRIELP